MNARIRRIVIFAIIAVLLLIGVLFATSYQRGLDASTWRVQTLAVELEATALATLSQ